MLPTDVSMQSPQEPPEEDVQSPDDYAATSPAMTEAGGVAWCEVWTERGFKINLTERRTTALAALDALMFMLRYAANRYHLKPHRPSTMITVAPTDGPAPQPPGSSAPVTTTSTPPAPVTNQVCKVHTVKHIKKKGADGKHMVIIGTAEYPDGVMAFDKQMKAMGVDYMTWNLFEEYTPPPQMAYAVVDPIKKWVVGFQPTP